MLQVGNSTQGASLGGNGWGQSAAVISSSQPPQVNALDQHENSLGALVGHLGNLNLRALNLSDRLFGSQPEAVSKSDPAPANPPTIRRLEDLMSMAHQQLEALSRHIERLELL